jgi:hypothetical protein
MQPSSSGRNAPAAQTRAESDGPPIPFGSVQIPFEIATYVAADSTATLGGLENPPAFCIGPAGFSAQRLCAIAHSMSG